MIRNFILIIAFTILGGSSSPLQENLNFDIVHKGNVIGSLNATKTIKDSKIYYKTSTTIKTRIIKDVSVNYKYNVVFNDDLLETSVVDITVNGKPHAKTHTKRVKSVYQVVKDGKNEGLLETSIYNATIQLYFEEPKNIMRCYSEQAGDFNTLEALGNHSYKKVNLKGRENIYYYNKGVLEKATIDGGLIKFEIIARNK
ncbi:DUF6134 family protein [Winogradskyella undariae]|uniref:DUF6134 family protein n=1 Tax=Winogradskyella undariae TaxID=1285465 RepID=UPI0015CA689A|nr:DUF6134 family protein [Winogradskyella undariae]QNK77107.1 hypothetical protein H7F37_13465 [Winogradskyella sp. PAMC22761]